MAIVTPEEIITRAEQIKNETNTGANTATRVGSWMRDSWDTMIDKFGSVVSASSFGIAIADIVNQLNSKAPTAYVDATFIPFGEKGSANGVPFLDANSKVPESQLPSFDLQKVTTTGNQTTNEIIVGNPTGFNVIIYPFNVTVDNNNPNINLRSVGYFLDGGISFRKALSSVDIRMGQYNNQTLLLPNTSGTLALQSELVTLQTQIDNINTLLQSNDVNLDNVQELVDAIKTVQTSLATILVNDLTTGGITKALTAEQGVVLKGLIDAIVPQPPLVNVDDVSFRLNDQNGLKTMIWRFRTLYNTYGVSTINWQFNNLFEGDDSNNSRLSLDWGLRQLIDFYQIPSLDWKERKLIDSTNQQVFDWQKSIFHKGISIGDIYSLYSMEPTPGGISFVDSAAPLHNINTLFVESGALKFKGGSGTVTTIAPA